MAFLEKLAKLDSAMQRGLDNGMALVFGGKVVPAEIDELLKQEAQDNLARGDDDNLYSPNVMTVGVSSKDLENLSQDRNLPADCADQLTRFIRNSGWSLAGPVIVRVAEESGLRTGQLRVSSFIDHEPTEETGFEAIFHDFDGQEDQMTEQHDNTADDAVTTAFIAPDSQPAPQPQGPAVNLMLQDGPRAFITCKKAPILSAAATTRTCACRIRAYPASTRRSPGTARMRFWWICSPPTAPR